MEITEPRQLWWLLLLLPVSLIWLRSYFCGKRDVVEIGGAWRADELVTVYLVKRFFSFLFFLLFLVCSVFALSDPRWGVRLVSAEQEGYEVILSVDVSQSMLAADTEPSRLERARFAVAALAEEMDDARFGLVVFRGDGERLLPVTEDTYALETALRGMHRGLVTTPGSNIERGIEVALDAFTGRRGSFRGIVLLILLGVRSADMVWLVYLTGFLESTASRFFGPANNALLPTLVGEEHLLSANSLDSLGENSARLIGPALGGVLLASAGLNSVIFLDITSYLMAALLMFMMQVPKLDSDMIDKSRATVGSAFSDLFGELIAGLRMVVRTKSLSRVFLVIGIAFLGDSILTVLFVPFIQEVVGVGSAEYGVTLTVRGLAGILGGLAVGAVGTKFKGDQLIGFGLIGTGIGIGAMVFWPVFTISLLILILLSLPLMSWLISSQTWIQTHVSDDYRGRVFGAYETFCALLMLIGMGFASAVGDSLGISKTLYISAGIYILAGMLAVVLLRNISPPPGKA